MFKTVYLKKLPVVYGEDGVITNEYTGTFNLATPAKVTGIFKPREDFFKDITPEEDKELVSGFTCRLVEEDESLVRLLNRFLSKGTYTLRFIVDDTPDVIPYIILSLDVIHDPLLDIYSNIVDLCKSVECNKEHCNSVRCLPRKTHEEILKEHRNDLASYVEKLSEKDSTLNTMKNEITKLEEDLESSSAELSRSSAELSSYKKELSSLRERNDELVEECESHKSAWTNLAAEVEHLTSLNQKLTRDYKAYHDKLQEAEDFIETHIVA